MTDVLAVMVKDGAGTLARCLESASGLVDSLLVVDTGSTDLTREIAAECGAEVVERPWVGFAHNRTELIGLARERSDRILMLDADMEIEEGGALPPPGPVDRWDAMMHYGTLSYRLPFLISSRKDWVYRGVIHEWLDCEQEIVTADTDSFVVLHKHSAGSRLESDRDLLEASGAADTRNLFYLAQTYRDLGDVDAAIACYLARAELGGFEEERYWSLYQAGSLVCAHRSFWEGAELLLRAHKLRPGRAESLRALAYCAMNVADQIPYPEADRLFVEPSAYAQAVDLPDAPVGSDA